MMPGTGQFLGVVERGEFHLVLPEPHSAGARKLTTVGVMAAEPSERGQLDLGPYEGSAILVAGQASGEWIFDAMVIEQAGPILTDVVRHVFAERRPGSTETPTG